MKMKSYLLMVIRNQVNVCDQHSPAAIPDQAEFVKCLFFRFPFSQELQIRLPLVADHFGTGEAPNRNDHVSCRMSFNEHLLALLALLALQIMKLRVRAHCSPEQVPMSPSCLAFNIHTGSRFPGGTAHPRKEFALASLMPAH